MCTGQLQTKYISMNRNDMQSTAPEIQKAEKIAAGRNAMGNDVQDKGTAESHDLTENRRLAVNEDDADVDRGGADETRKKENAGIIDAGMKTDEKEDNASMTRNTKIGKENNAAVTRRTKNENAEMAKVRTRQLNAALLQRQTPQGMAEAAGYALSLHGDARHVDRELAELQAVTAADVQRVLKKHVLDAPRVSIRYTQGAAT